MENCILEEEVKNTEMSGRIVLWRGMWVGEGGGEEEKGEEKKGRKSRRRKGEEE